MGPMTRGCKASIDVCRRFHPFGLVWTKWVSASANDARCPYVLVAAISVDLVTRIDVCRHNEAVSTESNWKLLGETVRRRREHLGMTQEDLASKGGPKTVTIRTIERAGAESFRPRTLLTLDDALGWSRGDSLALAEGRVPNHHSGLNLQQWADLLVERAARPMDFFRADSVSLDPALGAVYMTNERAAAALKAMGGQFDPESPVGHPHGLLFRGALNAFEFALDAVDMGASVEDIDRLSAAIWSIVTDAGSLSVIAAVYPEAGTDFVKLYGSVLKANYSRGAEDGAADNVVEKDGVDE